MTQLIITEKPSVSQKIAEALVNKKPKKLAYNKKVSYYELEVNGKKVFVVCAAGHLFTVAEKDKKKWDYPVFSVEWVPSYKVQKTASFTKPYIDVIKKVSKDADEYIVACDWDIEGEVIGYNILKFICKKNDSSRMHFSTTTKEDLLNAYNTRVKHLDKGLVESGLTRHVLDWMWGINLSRALTLSIKHATGMFKVLSSGRVQGPALGILVEREKEIKDFKSEPYWQVELVTKNGIHAWHKSDKFWKKEEATSVVNKTKGKNPVVKKVEKKEQVLEPPHPFDLTALQLEAYRKLGISPKETLALAQKLYVDSYISYPRTSSNQIPLTINVKKIIRELSGQKDYKKDAEKLAQKELKPNNGSKTDQAHPAIYPTGISPKKLNERAKKVYDLIVRRFLATFGEAAVKEGMSVELDVNGETFISKGARIVKAGWHELYGKYVSFKEEQLPDVKEGQELDVKEVKVHDKETQPPNRYTPASIIKELEKRNLGTKATRAEIIDALYQRDYVTERSMEVTELGMKTVETLKKYAPDIIDEELTRQFEREMEQIQEGKKDKEEVLKKAEQFLSRILEKFKIHEKSIGNSLSEAYKETRDKASIVGKCRVCGGDLRILYSKRFKSYFVACSSYPNCKTTYSLPRGLPKPTDLECPDCKYPMVMIIRSGRRPFNYCINKNCPRRLEWIKQQEEKKSKAEK